MNRIFTFGCSWTKHWWPTWADIIRYSVDIPVYNWGLGGIGNVGIFHRMVECDLKYKFTDKDLILVQWSSWTREDRYIDKWAAHGNIFNNHLYDETFIEKYWTWENDIIKNSTAIISANKIFDIKLQSTMISIGEHEATHKLLKDKKSNISEFYFDKIPKNIINFPNEKNSRFYGRSVDSHPDPLNHLYFYKNILRKNIQELPTCKVEYNLIEFQKNTSKLIHNRMSFKESSAIIKECSMEFDAQIFNYDGSF
jgi:hypothetical protein